MGTVFSSAPEVAAAQPAQLDVSDLLGAFERFTARQGELLNEDYEQSKKEKEDKMDDFRRRKEEEMKREHDQLKQFVEEIQALTSAQAQSKEQMIASVDKCMLERKEDELKRMTK